jgi:hypothetical protein
MVARKCAALVMHFPAYRRRVPRNKHRAIRSGKRRPNVNESVTETKRVALTERNPLIMWLAKPGKSEHLWVETVALTQLR